MFSPWSTPPHSPIPPQGQPDPTVDLKAGHGVREELAAEDRLAEMGAAVEEGPEVKEGAGGAIVEVASCRWVI